MDIHARLALLSGTKRLPVHFILNPGNIEYELGILVETNDTNGE